MYIALVHWYMYVIYKQMNIHIYIENAYPNFLLIRMVHNKIVWKLLV